MILGLSDRKQTLIALGSVVSLELGFLEIVNEKITRKFRVASGKPDYGYYWIDATNRSIFVELFSTQGLITSFSISLGNEFEEIFPNAISNWGSYFFNLHYSTG